MHINAPAPVAVRFHTVRHLDAGAALDATGVVLLVGVKDGLNVAIFSDEGIDRSIGATTGKKLIRDYLSWT